MEDKIIELTITFDSEEKRFNAELKHKCESIDVALDVLQEYINRTKKRKEKKLDA